MPKTLYCPKCPFHIQLNEGSVLLKKGINCPTCGEKLLIERKRGIEIKRVRGTTRYRKPWPRSRPKSIRQPPLFDKISSYKISQVSSITGVPSSAIRFWQKEFCIFFKTERTPGNQRVFSHYDIELIKRINELTSVSGFTLKGVHKILETDLNSESKDIFQKLNFE